MKVCLFYQCFIFSFFEYSAEPLSAAWWRLNLALGEAYDIDFSNGWSECWQKLFLHVRDTKVVKSYRIR